MTEENYKKFISKKTDRMKFIQDTLNSIGLDCPVISIEGKNHLYVKFPLSCYNSTFKIKTVIAHYDVFPGSSGANDNSSSVVSILDWIERLMQRKSFHNVRVIFTDGEEMGEDGVASQGAFALVQNFKRLGIVNDDVFVFDCMGRGTVPVICETKLQKNVAYDFKTRMLVLESKAEQIVRSAARGRWLYLPCNYSDNASFIAQGVPAVAITMLPSVEAEMYLKNGIQPYTWQMLHTADDSYENLTHESFEIAARILDNLADLKTLS